jgi:hypothetical protein
MKAKKLRSLKTITFSLPFAMGREIEEDAQEEHRTISEFMRELYRQYKARKVLRQVSKIARATVKKQGLTPEDFGISSEDI